eukprot:jgi/Mesvir1/7961/Mv11873-RA.1
MGAWNRSAGVTSPPRIATLRDGFYRLEGFALSPRAPDVLPPAPLFSRAAGPVRGFSSGQVGVQPEGHLVGQGGILNEDTKLLSSDGGSGGVMETDVPGLSMSAADIGQAEGVSAAGEASLKSPDSQDGGHPGVSLAVEGDVVAGQGARADVSDGGPSPGAGPPGMSGAFEGDNNSPDNRVLASRPSDGDDDDVVRCLPLAEEALPSSPAVAPAVDPWNGGGVVGEFGGVGGAGVGLGELSALSLGGSLPGVGVGALSGTVPAVSSDVAPQDIGFGTAFGGVAGGADIGGGGASAGARDGGALAGGGDGVGPERSADGRPAVGFAAGSPLEQQEQQQQQQQSLGLSRQLDSQSPPRPQVHSGLLPRQPSGGEPVLSPGSHPALQDMESQMDHREEGQLRDPTTGVSLQQGDIGGAVSSPGKGGSSQAYARPSQQGQGLPLHGPQGHHHLLSQQHSQPHGSHSDAPSHPPQSHTSYQHTPQNGGGSRAAPAPAGHRSLLPQLGSSSNPLQEALQHLQPPGAGGHSPGNASGAQGGGHIMLHGGNVAAAHPKRPRDALRNVAEAAYRMGRAKTQAMRDQVSEVLRPNHHAAMRDAAAREGAGRDSASISSNTSMGGNASGSSSFGSPREGGGMGSPHVGSGGSAFGSGSFGSGSTGSTGSGNTVAGGSTSSRGIGNNILKGVGNASRPMAGLGGLVGGALKKAGRGLSMPGNGGGMGGGGGALPGVGVGAPPGGENVGSKKGQSWGNTGGRLSGFKLPTWASRGGPDKGPPHMVLGMPTHGGGSPDAVQMQVAGFNVATGVPNVVGAKFGLPAEWLEMDAGRDGAGHPVAGVPGTAAGSGDGHSSGGGHSNVGGPWGDEYLGEGEGDGEDEEGAGAEDGEEGDGGPWDHAQGGMGEQGYEVPGGKKRGGEGDGGQANREEPPSVPAWIPPQVIVGGPRRVYLGAGMG